MGYKWPIALIIILIQIALYALGIWSVFLWKKTSGKKKLMYLIGGVIMLLFAVGMTTVFMIGIF
ncbi:MAG: hypothetical protein KKG59_03095 [Nanoarchaeota archaeon]|nr:hypothetical protein [Nanoarchaeota archaeon]